MFNLTPQERKAAIFLIITLALGSGILFYKNIKGEVIKPELVKAKSSEEAKADAKEETIVVHLAGAVFRPGLYQVKKGTRVGELIEKAELLAQADISNLNLARFVSDGEKIFIPSKTNAEPVGPADSSPSLNKTGEEGLININQASVLELSRLPGIGEVLAQRIIAYREQFGQFQSKEELKEVKGIGKKRFEKIESLICIH